jgi:hypothetical protein
MRFRSNGPAKERRSAWDIHSLVEERPKQSKSIDKVLCKGHRLSISTTNTRPRLVVTLWDIENQAPATTGLGTRRLLA